MTSNAARRQEGIVGDQRGPGALGRGDEGVALLQRRGEVRLPVVDAAMLERREVDVRSRARARTRPSWRCRCRRNRRSSRRAASPSGRRCRSRGTRRSTGMPTPFATSIIPRLCQAMWRMCTNSIAYSTSQAADHRGRIPSLRWGKPLIGFAQPVRSSGRRTCRCSRAASVHLRVRSTTARRSRRCRRAPASGPRWSGASLRSGWRRRRGRGGRTSPGPRLGGGDRLGDPLAAACDRPSWSKTRTIACLYSG